MYDATSDNHGKQDKHRLHLLKSRPEVIQRWVRVKMISTSRDLARTYMRLRLPFAERSKKNALLGAFNAIKNQAARCERNGYRDSHTILNIALYFLIAERDIQAVKLDALTHPDEWKRKLSARVILLTIYEWDADKVSGQALRTALENIKASDNVRREATESLRLVRIAQRKARKELHILRNATIAHRDPDALFQYRAISNLDVASVIRLAGDFYEASERFIALLPQMILESSTIPALLRQRLAQRD